MPPSCRPIRPPRALAVFAATLGLFVSPIVVRAGFWETFLHKDVDVVTVTDVTEAGRSYPPASPARPVRYMLIYVGEATFGRSWAGESIPPKKEIIQWMLAAMKAQGYLPADKEHPPEQIFVFGWGLMAGGEGSSAFSFLGGDKIYRSGDQYQYGRMVYPNVLCRNMYLTGLAGQVWDIAESSLFVGVVRSFTVDSFDAPKVTMLWETRFGCSAIGLALDETMPGLLKAASLNFGRETRKPVLLDATEILNGNVSLGELKVLGEFRNLEDANLPEKMRRPKGKPAE